MSRGRCLHPEYGEGIRLIGTPLWFDSSRGRDLSFISAADILGANRHRRIIASSRTSDLLYALCGAYGHQRRSRVPLTLTAPFGRSFDLGSLRLEIFPSGYWPGSSSLLVTWRGQRIVFSGKISASSTLSTEELDARPCDVLILANLSSVPAEDDPEKSNGVEKGVARFVRESHGDKSTPVLLFDRFDVMMEVGLHLAGQGIDVVLHRRGHCLFRIFRRILSSSGPKPGRYRGGRISSRGALLWPLSLHASPAIADLVAPRFALIQRQRRDPLPTITGLDTFNHFAIGGDPDQKTIVDYVSACDPKRTFIAGEAAPQLIDVVRSKGVDAREIDSRGQLNLSFS